MLLGMPVAGCNCSDELQPPADAGGASDDAGLADAGRIDPDELCETRALPDWVAGDAQRFDIACAGFELSLSAWQEGIVRLRYGEKDADRSFAVVAQPEASALIGFGGDADSFRLCTPEITVSVARDCRVRAVGRDGEVLLEDPEDGGWFLVAGERGVERVAAPGEHFYGFGEKGGPFDKRGQKMEMWNSDPFVDEWGGYPPGTDPLYQAIPFFIGLRGEIAYGLFTDNSWRTRFDMGATERSRYRVSAEGGAIDQYLIAGPSMAKVLERYTWLTGRMPLPPRWALGYHQSRWGYYPDTEVRQIAEELRSRRIPADGIWLDIQHMDGFRSFTWEPAGFSDPEGLVAGLEALGFKTTAIVDPGIKVDPAWDVYQSGFAGGHFLKSADGQPYVGEVWPGPSVFPDFSSAGTREWWKGLVARLAGKGVRGVWIDMNEPTSFRPELGNTVPNELVSDGDGYPMTMAEGHNLYALFEARATYDALRAAAPERRPFLLTRAGYAGEQRYTAVWTGDAPSRWETLRETVPMLLNLGLSGVTFAGSDVGGYGGDATAELFARWMQVGGFSPFFRGHCQTTGNRQEPWAFGVEVEDISRAVIQERYELMPYLYSLFRQASLTGTPVLRPLVYEFQTDEQSRTIGDEVLLGPSILYAPVLREGATTRTVYLPPGRWYESYSGKVIEGPKTFDQPVFLGARPTFVREGAIVPRFNAGQWTDQRTPDVLYLDVYPGAQPSAFELYEDEGDSFAYEQGAYSLVRYELTRRQDGATLKASAREGSFEPAARLLSVRFRRVDHPLAGVSLDGEPLTAQPSLEALIAAGRGYWYDEGDLALLAVMPDRAGFELRADYDPELVAPAPPVEVRFEVKVPAGTPTDRPITIATSANGWQHQALEWTGPSIAAGSVSLPRGEWFEYKYARGGWETVEKWDGCQEASNRYGFAAAHPIRIDTVYGWADWCH
jgi:alpha-glucosidase